MLTAKYNLKGITLVELIVAVAIVGILFAAAAPNFSQWIQNSKVRSAAESIQNGLTIAKMEAVHRNAQSQFVLCANGIGGLLNGSWDVTAVSGTASTNLCGGAAKAGWERSQKQDVQNSPSVPLIVAIQPSTGNAQTTVGFNSLGKQVSTNDLINGVTTPDPAVAVAINVSSTLAGATCLCPATIANNCGYPNTINSSTAGTLRCMRVGITNGGQVRMCDPALPLGSPQGPALNTPQGC